MQETEPLMRKGPAILGQFLADRVGWYAASDWLEEQGRDVESAGLRWLAWQWRSPARLRWSKEDVWEWYEWFPEGRPSPYSTFGQAWLPVGVFVGLRWGELKQLEREHRTPRFRVYCDEFSAILDAAWAAGMAVSGAIDFGDECEQGQLSKGVWNG